MVFILLLCIDIMVIVDCTNATDDLGCNVFCSTTVFGLNSTTFSRRINRQW